MSAFTKGPWEVSYWRDGLGPDKPAVTASGATIAITHPAPICPIEESTANAHLIAAAPDMYEALDTILSWIDNWSPNFEDDDEWVDDRKRFDAILAKARGES